MNDNPVFVAIDTPDLVHAQALAWNVSAHVGGIKLGLEFFGAHGPAGVTTMATIGLPIFLDLKLHDIPNTVASAVRALASLAPAVLSVHAAGGRTMLEAAKEAAPARTKVVAVTVLTSLDADDLNTIGVAGDAAAQVNRLSTLAAQAGLDGAVCSPWEVAAVRAVWPQGYLVVPGVRPEGTAADDQKRVMTPRAAREAGASILVIGRPITGATDPRVAAAAIEATL